MGNTPAEDVYLKSAHKAKTLLPIFPLPPDPGKDCVYGHFSHFNRHFPGRLSLRGQRSISHILTGAFSYCQLPQQRPNGPVQGLLRGRPRGHDGSLVFDQLVALQTTLSFSNTDSKEGYTGSIFIQWRFLFLTFFEFSLLRGF